MNYSDEILTRVTKQPTLLQGLKWFPSLEPHVSNDQDHPPFSWPPVPLEISDCNLAVVALAISELGHSCKSILEIGVGRNQDRSFFHIITQQKPSSAVYLGVDLQEHTHIQDPSLNRWFLKTNSFNQAEIRNKLQELGANSLSLLIIDGWHSINTAVNDWKYADMVHPGGIVLIHDTNAHPGPVALFDAIDDQIWEKHKLCTSVSDYGIGYLKRK
jgi:hypothetical protein